MRKAGISMFSMIEFVLEIVIFPLVDLFVSYDGNVIRWIADGVFYFTGIIFALLAVAFFSMGIWPLGLIAGVLTVVFLILHGKNYAERRQKRSQNVAVPVDEKAFEEEWRREKVEEYRNSLNKQF